MRGGEVGVEFRLLGEPELWANGLKIEIGSPKQRVVLVALLLAGGRALSVDTLVERVWGDEPPARCRNVLATYFSRLRRVLAAIPGAELAISHRSGLYRMTFDPAVVDVFRFRAQVAQAKEADGVQAVELFDRALGLWRGPPLDGLASAWIADSALRLQRERRDAHAARIDVLLRLDRHAEAINGLYPLVAEHPLDEQFCAQLVEALHRAGRTAEAIEQYHGLRGRLADQLGIDPSPTVQALYQELLTAGQQPPPTLPRPAQLPADVMAFTGRDAALRELDGLLQTAADSTAPMIVVLAGTAGVGKTALAVHWSHRVRGAFPDGQLYVNLHGYSPASPTRPFDALAQILRALGVAAQRIPGELDEAAALYRSVLADRRMLVVLDNARTAEQVRPLLPGSGGCLAVVTSRDALTGMVAQDGAHRLVLDVLGEAEAVELLARLLGTERVDRERQATVQLAVACARLPLALRISAANFAGRAAIAGYVSELARGDRLTALRASGDPQVAVRAAIDLSYARLPVAARRQFRLLGLSPGPELTVHVGAALAGVAVGEARQLLELLADAHLVQEHSPGRYGFHDLLRLHAIERTRAEDDERERVAALDRLYDHYLNNVATAAQTLYPHMLRLPGQAPAVAPDWPGGHTGASAWLEAERANLVAMVTAAAGHGRPAMAWLLADALRGYFSLSSHVVDWLTVGQAALTAAQATEDDHALAAAHLGLANLHGARSRGDLARVHYIRALAAARRAGWVECQASVLGNLGSVYRQAGRLKAAGSRYRQALALNRRLDRLGGQATNLANLAAISYELGQLSEAFEHDSQALDLYKKIGSRSGEATALSDLGEIYHSLGRVAAALEHLTRSLRMQREVGSRTNEAETLRCLAAVHRDTGRIEVAAGLAAQALRIARETGERRYLRMALNTAASIAVERGRPEEAVAQHQEALRLAREDGHRYCEADALVGLSAALARLGRPEEALARAAQANDVARQHGFRVVEGLACAQLAAVRSEGGDLAAARQYGARAMELLRQTDHSIGLGRALRVMADVERRG